MNRTSAALAVLGILVAVPSIGSAQNAPAQKSKFRRIQDLTRVLAKEAGELSTHFGEIRAIGQDVHTYLAEVKAVKEDPELSPKEKTDMLFDLGVGQLEKVLGKTDSILKVGENRYILMHRAQVIRRLIASGNEDKAAYLDKRKEQIRREESIKRRELRKLVAMAETRDLSMSEKSQLERHVRELEALGFEKNLMGKMRLSLKTLQERIGTQQRVILKALDRIDSFFQRYDAFCRTMALKLSYMRAQLDNLAVIQDYSELYHVLDEFHGKGFAQLSTELDHVNDLFADDLFPMISELGGLPSGLEGAAEEPFTTKAREESIMRRARNILDGLN